MTSLRKTLSPLMSHKIGDSTFLGPWPTVKLKMKTTACHLYMKIPICLSINKHNIYKK